METTPDQIAAARAFILNNPDTVLTRHLEIEKRIAADKERAGPKLHQFRKRCVNLLFSAGAQDL